MPPRGGTPALDEDECWSSPACSSPRPVSPSPRRPPPRLVFICEEDATTAATLDALGFARAARRDEDAEGAPPPREVEEAPAPREDAEAEDALVHVLLLCGAPLVVAAGRGAPMDLVEEVALAVSPPEVRVLIRGSGLKGEDADMLVLVAEDEEIKPNRNHVLLRLKNIQLADSTRRSFAHHILIS